jgi:hypothetical protein
MIISAAHCRSARDLLGWTKERLALESGAAPKTIVKFEAGMRITETLAAAGVEFIPEKGGGAGVRLRKA